MAHVHAIPFAPPSPPSHYATGRVPPSAPFAAAAAAAAAAGGGGAAAAQAPTPPPANEATEDLPNGINVKNIPQGASAKICFCLNV